MDSVERIQPPNLTAEVMERHVLGLLIQYPIEGKTVGLPLLRLNDFYNTANRLIYQAVVAVADSGALPEMTAIVQVLREAHQLEGIGGPIMLARLTMQQDSPVNLEAYCRVLNQHRAKRELLAHAHGIFRALEQDEDIFDVLAAGEKAFTSISQSFVQTTMHTLKSSSMEGISMLVDRLNNPKRARVQLGLSVLDNAVGGLEAGDVVVYAARSGIGKTDMLVQIARHNGLVQKLPGVIFSLEMTRVQMAFRFTAHPSGVPASITRSEVSSEQIWNLSETVEKHMDGADLIVLDDTPGLTTPALRAALMRTKAKFPDLAWIIVDYIQLMKGMKGSTAEEATKEASMVLKEIAKEFGIVVFELAQLKPEVDKRTPLPVPIVSDLRGSSQIEMDADMIIMPWRPSFYGKDCDSNGDPIPEIEVKEYVEFIIGKNRHKAPSVAVGRYHAGESRFSCWSPVPMTPIPDENLPF
jgi:replicative DNA helicase